MIKFIAFVLFFCLVLRVSFTQNTTLTYYSFDGSGNNVANPTWGKVGTAQLRKFNSFQDKISVPTGGNPSGLPNARFVSNTVFNRVLPGNRAESKKATALLTYFGQFVDHDITSTSTSNPCELFAIPIPRGDPIYDPLNFGNQTMRFCRSTPIAGSGQGADNPRNYANNMNGFLDASVIYGLDQVTSDALRTKEGGLLKTSKGPDGDLLPLNNNGTGGPLVRMGNGGPFPITQIFAAGEGRANVSPLLACIHTLFFREHNRRARTLSAKLSDEERFQKARRLTTAVYQRIVMEEFIPSMIGEKLPAYTGYKPDVNPQTDIFFSTVSFRVGHDQLSPILERLDVNGKTISEGNVLVRDGFFNPTFIANTGIGPLLRGSVVHSQENIDAMMIDDVRNFLFGQTPFTATDLAARNIQRARDNGVGSYNDARQAFGLPRCNDFNCVTSDPVALDALNKAYGKDNVTFLDPFVGALIENKRNGALVGDLLYKSIQEQFIRYRDGDRFWYQNKGILTADELKEIEKTTLSDVITRNTNSKNIPANVFARSGLTATQTFNPGDDTKWIIAIIVLSIACAILIALLITTCFAAKKNVNNGHLYNSLVEK